MGTITKRTSTQGSFQTYRSTNSSLGNWLFLGEGKKGELSHKMRIETTNNINRNANENKNENKNNIKSKSE